MTAAVFLIGVALGLLACNVVPRLRRRTRPPLAAGGGVLMRQEVTMALLRDLAETCGVTWTPEMSSRRLWSLIKQSIAHTSSRCERAEAALWELLGMSMGRALPPRPPEFDADAAARQITSQWPRGA